MFLRIETSLKSDFSDPIASLWKRRLRAVNPTLAEKIRWARRLDVAWLEVDGPRDRIIQAVQTTFRNPVLNWIFTGDLLPSAAGTSGTLQDLMQAAPVRPGVFWGIEKRKRQLTQDQNAQILLDALQTVLKNRNSQDRVITGELLVLEGPKLDPADLEWIAQSWFTDEKYESWSLISEEELRKNSRFQMEQVAKYLSAQQSQVSARWLQYRNPSRQESAAIDWLQIEDLFKKVSTVNHFSEIIEGEEWALFPKVEFSTLNLSHNTRYETEIALLKPQVEMNVENCVPRLQMVLGVLPQKDRLWLKGETGFHPERIWSEYTQALQTVAETTSTPVIQAKCLEEGHEQEPSFFWTSTLGVSATQLPPKMDLNDPMDWIWIGPEDRAVATQSIYVEKLKEVKDRCEQAHAILFSRATSGMLIQDAFRSADRKIEAGVDLLWEGHVDWWQKAMKIPLPLSQLWGVRPEQREWVLNQLKIRNLNWLALGSTAQHQKFRILLSGQTKIEIPIEDFLKKIPKSESRNTAIEATLLDDIVYMQDPLLVSDRARFVFSAEELLIKTQPVVIRPQSHSWAGIMVLSELLDSTMSILDLEWMLRRCTAMGGQVHSLQMSMVNGLKSWMGSVRELASDFGIHLSQVESRSEPALRGHWCAIQFLSSILDVRSIRGQHAKTAGERIYWLDGRFDQPAFRWLCGLEGRHQGGIASALAVFPQGLRETLVHLLVAKTLGAEVEIAEKDHSFGFVITISENDRFAVEEEMRTLEIQFEFLGKTATSPYLLMKEAGRPAQTWSIEDAKALLEKNAWKGLST